MTPKLVDQGAKAASASAAQDPFDLDVSVIESGGTAGVVAASEGGCAASCGNACASSVA
ncbi:FxLD family lanthipeptide [Streptomyces pseudogriseolus]|uniref:FxLD family lanthipeptide n=1 Tax=Streptomyces pseudogriseolus TaxID=36817 RepID=UPI003FA3051A